MSDLYPSMDDALLSARLYLTAKTATKQHLDDFEAKLPALRVAPQRRAAVVQELVDRLHNTNRLDQARATAEAQKIAAYAAGHAERAKTFIHKWLDVRRGASEECDTRIAALRRALGRAL